MTHTSQPPGSACGGKSRLRLAPLLPPAVSMLTGIIAGRWFPFFPFTVILLTAVAVIVHHRLFRPGRAGMAAVAACFLFGALSFHLYGPGAPTTVDGMLDGGVVAVTGEVARPPEERVGYTLVHLKVDETDNDTPGLRIPPRPGLVRMTVQGNGLGIAYGDVLTGRMELLPPAGYRNFGCFDYGAYAALNGVDAAAYCEPRDIAVSGNRAGRFMAWLYAYRERLLDVSGESLDGPASALFRAMVLGDQGSVPDEMRDEFAASGTTHILSVSGSHVAMLAMLVYFLAKWSVFVLPHRYALRLSMKVDTRKLGAAVSIPAAIFYCMLAGSEVATVRSVIMITAFLGAILLDRESDAFNVLSAAALAALVFDPGSVFDISFQLSYGAVLFMALAPGRPARDPDTGPAGWRERWREVCVNFTVVSVFVIAGTAPLVAGQFNAFSWVALPANALAIPLIGVGAVPVGILSCLLYAVSPGGGLPLAWLNTAIYDVFYAVVRAFAAIPHANLHPGAPGLLLTSVFLLLVAASVYGGGSRMRKAAVVSVCAGVMLLTGSLSFGSPRGLRVTFLDVGQGDGALVEFPDGSRMLVDGGGKTMGIDPGRSAVAPYLWNHGARSLERVVLTHPHPDHMNGLFYIFENFGVDELWEGGLVTWHEGYKYIRRLAEARGTTRRVFSSPVEMEVGGAAVQVLSTSKSEIQDGRDDIYDRENNRSLVLRIVYGDVSFLLGSDAESAAQEAMLATIPAGTLRSTVLKVPHHGSRSGSLGAFVDSVRPEVAVISAGRRNRFGHPAPETLAALEDAGARVYRTDLDGAVSVVTDGKAVEVHTYADTEFEEVSGWAGEWENWRRVWVRWGE
ncbi:MAG: DNA internalization-related competence protein ComEC/Rec2 [Nitrospirae bacterium]|nr:DNA internalization-related competence protein ComEC/Rec2 [Nitrospirota bacterium]